MGQITPEQMYWGLAIIALLLCGLSVACSDPSGSSAYPPPRTLEYWREQAKMLPPDISEEEREETARWWWEDDGEADSSASRELIQKETSA